MRFGVLGTGMVGNALATKLVELRHEVCMGSRRAGSEKAVTWVGRAGPRASEGTFSDAAAFGEVVINCTAGVASLEALRSVGGGHLDGKVLVDVANPLDFSRGMPPTQSVPSSDSLGEQIQREFPRARVVKTLNTMNAEVMTNPRQLPETHAVFVSGNDGGAKEQVRGLLESFDWPAESIVDLGDITTARGTEMYLQLWLRLYGALGSPRFNIKIVR